MADEGGTRRPSTAPDDDAPTRGAASYERDGSVYDSAPDPTSTLGQLRFMPSVIYSGVDGEHTFKAPIAVYDADRDDVTIVADDPSAVSIERATLNNPAGDTGTYFLVTTRVARSVVLTATSKGRTATAKMLITSYDGERYARGEARYQNGGPSGNPPCTRCHAGGSAIDHSPATMASAADPQVGNIITNGVRPGPAPITNVSCADCTPEGRQHRWSVTPDQKEGLITYLRSLEPRGFTVVK